MRALLLSLAAAAAVGSGAAAGHVNGDDQKGIAPARDGNIAIREELEQARKANTVAAYDLFIARHPQHELARIARDERARLLCKTRRP